jgi:uncharacterized repeat protein (TIGR01451 family)
MTTFHRTTITRAKRAAICAPAMAASFVMLANQAFATIDNQATASGFYGATGVTSPASALIKVPVAAGTPKLSISKSLKTPVGVTLGLDNAIVDAGDQIVYEYIITNNGNMTITAVTPVDPGPKFGTAQAAGTGSIAFTLTSGTTTLLPGQIAKFDGVYTLSQLDVDRAAGIVAPATSVNNTATPTGKDPGGATIPAMPPSTVVNTTIPAAAKLTVVKSAVLNDITAPGNTALFADVGETIAYTYVVKNVGNVAITNVKVNDTHEGTLLGPTVVANETLTTEGPLGTPASTDVTAPLNNGTWSTLQPGATITFTYTHTVTQAEVDGG